MKKLLSGGPVHGVVGPPNFQCAIAQQLLILANQDHVLSTNVVELLRSASRFIKDQEHQIEVMRAALVLPNHERSEDAAGRSAEASC